MKRVSSVIEHLSGMLFRCASYTEEDYDGSSTSTPQCQSEKTVMERVSRVIKHLTVKIKVFQKYIKQVLLRWTVKC